MVELAGELFEPDDLAPLMMRCDLWHGRGGESLKRAVLNDMLAARAEAQDGDLAAHRSLLRLAQLIIEKRANHPLMSPRQLAGLREALLADGYEVTWELSLLPHDYTAACTIRPTDAAPVPLAAEISALEAELSSRGYASVLNHYRQAVDGLSHHKYESANGDLRTALEGLVVRLAADHAGYHRQPRAGQGAQAIHHLRTSGQLSDDDGGLLLSGLWKLTHTNGPHPGQSDADEARFRMQVITATARFLLRHFSPAASQSPPPPAVAADEASMAKISPRLRGAIPTYSRADISK